MKSIFSSATLLLIFLFHSLLSLAQPANDNCVNAISLTPSANLSCTNTSGTNSGVVSTDFDGCAELDKRTVWYKFTATNANHIVQLTLGTMTNGIIDVSTGSCASGSDVSTCNRGKAGPVITNSLSGLTVGQEYLVAISTSDVSEEGTFNICIFTPQPPPNNECTTAASLTVNASNVPAAKTSGTTLFATQSQVGCTGTADDDVWYSFVATQVIHRVHVFYTTGFFSVEAFSGGCGSLVSIACTSPSGINKTVALQGLTPGQTYLFRVYSFGSAVSNQGSFQIAVTSAPQNDECINAVNITPSTQGNNVCTSAAAGGTFDAKKSSADCFGGNSTSNDTWYKFTASQGVHTIKVQGFGSNSVRFEVMSGSCNSLTSLTCTTPTFVSDTAMKTIGNLTPGQDYFVRVYSGNSGGIEGLFNVCVTSPAFPPNDGCLNAVTLLPAADSTTNFVNSSTTGATNAPVSNSCNSVGLDVWYKFTATSISHVVKTVNLTNRASLTIELFSGTCGALIHERCSNAGDTLFGMGNLTIGQTYVVRVYNGSQFFGDDFKIAVFTPQALANDECSMAINIIPSTDATCTEISGTNIGATQSINDNCTGNALIGNIKDVWYRFTASSASHRVKLIRGTGENLRFKIYSGSCNNLTAINCSVQNTSSVIGTAIEQRFNGLTIGNAYFIRVFNNGVETAGTFDLCIKTVVVPANDECATAATLTPQENITFGTYTFGTTIDASQSSQATLCSTGQDDDVWYSFTATQANMKVLLQNAGIGATRIAVYSGSCAALILTRCQTGSTRDNSMPLFGLTVGTVYLVRVYSTSATGSQGNFSIIVTADVNLPANDDCTNATELFPSTGNICLSTQGSVIDAGGSSSACVNGFEVWYKFAATASSHRVNVEGFLVNPVVTVFSGSCAAAVQLPSACAIGNNQVSLTVSNLTVGETYLIKVLDNSLSGFSQSIFNICITTPQVRANDLCANAIGLPVNNNANAEPQQLYSTNLATVTNASACFATGNDVWFSFVAPQGPVTIEVNALNTNAGIELMSGSCGSLTSVMCNGTSNIDINNILNANNLAVGNTYFIRVSASTFSSPLEFKIKVFKSLSIKLNSTTDTTGFSNNLVQNQSFEPSFPYQSSFTAAANPGAELIPKWRIPTRGTSDFFTGLNSNSSSAEVPGNLCFGSQSARNGHGYGGFFAYTSGSTSYREYLENELSAAMVPGKQYVVSMYVSLAEFSTIAIDNIGIALRTTQTKELTFSNLNYTPQVVSANNLFIKDKKTWVNISALITADQPYKYIVIGNFKNNALTDTIRIADTSRALSGGTFPGCATTSQSAYYFIDDVLVSAIDGNVQLCANGNSTITSSIAGSNYQWQANSGSGFINLTDNANYAGTNTPTLQLNNIPSSFNGTIYRCVVDGVNSTEVVLKISNSWTGAVSTAWENPANWSCNTVPDINTDVIIFNGTVEVNSNAACRSLSLNPDTHVTVKPGFNLLVAH